MKSGKAYLLDTNAVIALLAGDVQIASLLKGASWLGISVITYLEFLSFSKLSSKDEELFKLFCSRLEVCSLEHSNPQLLEEIISFRKDGSVKLPDAIICMTAKHKNALLLTKDIQLLKLETVSAVQW